MSMSYVQDQIHAKHSQRLAKILRDAAKAVKEADFDWAQESATDAYYYDRRSAEREYAAALNATSRIERFLSK